MDGGVRGGAVGADWGDALMARKLKDDEQTTEQAEWCEEITRYEIEADKWIKRAKDTTKRYKDERADRDGTIRFNVLWSNVQVLKPALYAQDPIPRVERRFRDANPVGRQAADILRRALSYSMECTHFGDVVREAVHDRLVPGRGVTWIRYVPHFKDVDIAEPATVETGAQVTDDVQTDESEQELLYEECPPDYVNWEDFGHTFARTWEEVRGCWRRVYMSRAELIERFGAKVGKEITLDYAPWAEKGKPMEKNTKQMKKACVYEIWDKQDKKAIWLHKDHDDLLDKRDDPLELTDFFPCPMPMFANLANDTLIPTPDYIMYQDQALELDELTARIANIAKNIKVAGVYDAKAEGIGRILAEGIENKLVPVNQWTSFAERGGLKSAMDLLPTREMAQTLIDLISTRERTKQDLYEITGISDIIRGFSSGGAKTATEQQIKSQFANLRLSEQQREVARFARDMLRIMGQIIAFHFSQTTLAMMTGVKLLTADEKQRAQAMQQQQQAAMQQHQMAAQQMQQAGQPVPPPPQMQPLPPELVEAMGKPTWDEVMAMLRNKASFEFNIEIETDSTISTDDENEKKQSIELIQAIGSFGQGTAIAIQQGLLDSNAARAILKVILRRHGFSTDIEEILDKVQPAQNQQAQQQAQKLQQAQQELQKQKMDLEQQALQNKTDKEMLTAQKQAAEQSLALKDQQQKGQAELREQKQAMDAEAAANKLKAMLDSFVLKVEGMVQKGKADAAAAEAKASAADAKGEG
jgi:hypothetical protein